LATTPRSSKRSATAPPVVPSAPPAEPPPALASPVVSATSPVVSQTKKEVAEEEPERPSYRALRVYAFDPSRGRRLGNYMTVRVKYEKLEEGLRGDQLHVVDYDATNDTYYKTAKLNSQAALVEGGLAPSESDPRFHQQMVYAVAMNTIRTFESALGRDIRYKFGERTQLRILPHAMYEPNAYYSRDLGALLFGYFRASSEDPGSGLPNGTVFTCLSHDIIAHETTHSIVDTLRSSFMEPSNPDVLAFHEAFADIVALFQHFAFEEVVRDTLQRTGGVLHRFELAPRGTTGEKRGENGGGGEKHQSFIIGEMAEGNPLLDLARQFGESMGRRAALRSALGVPPDPRALDKATEAHERGAVLVAAVFDAFFSSFMQRTADLIRLARTVAGTSGEIHPDIAARLAKEAAKTAQHFCTMCIRALDYCPPVDISFGDFLRALITADTELYAADAHDYREALIQAFRARGIYPQDVFSLAEESLVWTAPEPGTPECGPLCFDLLKPYEHSDTNKAAVEVAVRQCPFAFGLCENDDHRRETCTCRVPDGEEVVLSVNFVLRGGSQRAQVEFVAEILRSVPFEDHPGTKFSGGATVVFKSDGKPKLIIYKRLASKNRRKSQAEFIETALGLTPFANYTDMTDVPLGLAAVHRGC
jgi:hypothetical protein